MNALEWRVAFSLSAVYAVRMLGLFMILPVFALYAQTLPDANASLIGLAIGIYGLTQASLQIPLGMASDKIGRKPVIIGGLTIFAIGSLVAATADSLWLIILGRFLQGMGAVAAATMALAADLTREENRSRVMAFIGLSIGLSFMVAVIIGPLIYSYVGMSGLFGFTALLALIGILLIIFVVPTPLTIRSHRDTGIIGHYLRDVVKNKALLNMNAGVFVLHLILTANFLVLPSLFNTQLHLATAEHWKIYLPVFVIAFAAAIPLIIVAEKRQKIKLLLRAMIGLLVLAELILATPEQPALALIAGFFLFFLAFNFLEAVQPSLVAKYSPVDMKGTAMGVYNSTQFLGIFAGGVLGGWVLQHWQATGVFWMSAVIGFVWLLFTRELPTPTFYSSRVIKIEQPPQDWQQLYTSLRAVAGVHEVSIVVEEQVAYLKVDKSALDEVQLRAISGASA